MVRLAGRVILPADTFLGGPPAGAWLESGANGRRPPFPEQPVQGISGLVLLGTDRAYALSDNGFGTRRNSPDAVLRWTEVFLDWMNGRVAVLTETRLSDPRGHIPFPIQDAELPRGLTGADFDVESIARGPDRMYWLGDEFGPFLLHVDAEGRLLDPPFEVPAFPALLPFARGEEVLRSPDHPELRGATEEDRDAVATVRRSAGFEALTYDPATGLLLAMLEGALRDDPIGERRWVLGFSPIEKRFTGVLWSYRTEDPEHSIGDMTALGDGTYLVVERDDAEGKKARFKKVYRVSPPALGPESVAEKALVADLLRVEDSAGITHPENGAVGLGREFAFPFVTIEAIAVLDRETLLLCNDNNYPSSAGRRPGVPDDTEFIRIRLAEPLTP